MAKTNSHLLCDLLHKKRGHLLLPGIYKIHLGKRQKQDLWIVDGLKIVSQIYPAFVMGGNDQRYRFNPKNEIWIDNRIGSEEINYTIHHELVERNLMKTERLNYDHAHDLALEEERSLRIQDKNRAAAKSNHTGHQNHFYRCLYQKSKNLTIWIVDGPEVRRELDANFCFGTNDLASSYLPSNEIWLDSSMSSEQTYYALFHQFQERKCLAEGMLWDFAYETALVKRIAEQKRQADLARAHEARLEPVSYGVRKKGSRDTT